LAFLPLLAGKATTTASSTTSLVFLLRLAGEASTTTTSTAWAMLMSGKKMSCLSLPSCSLMSSCSSGLAAATTTLAG